MIGISDVFVALLAGHYAGDYIAQTDWQAIHKSEPFRHTVDATTGEKKWTNAAAALGGHVAGQLACQALAVVLLWIAGASVPVLAACAALAFSIATHGFIDRRWPVRWLMENTGSAPFAQTPGGPPLVDQALHIVCVYLAALIFAVVAR